MPKVIGDIKYITKEEILQLLKVVDNPRDKLMIKLMYATFIRSNELRNIKISDIKFDENYIHIRAENTKTKKSRLVVIPEVLKKEI